MRNRVGMPSSGDRSDSLLRRANSSIAAPTITHAAPATPTISPESGLVRSVIIRVMAAAKAMAAAQNRGLLNAPERFLGQQAGRPRGNGSCASSFQGVFRCRILPSAGFASRRGSVFRRRAASSPGPLPRRRRFAKRWRLLGEALHVPQCTSPLRVGEQAGRHDGRRSKGGFEDGRGQRPQDDAQEGAWRQARPAPMASPCREPCGRTRRPIPSRACRRPIPAPDRLRMRKAAKQEGRKQEGRSQAAARRMLRTTRCMFAGAGASLPGRAFSSWTTRRVPAVSALSRQGAARTTT